jgi:hypothetical protein
MSRRWGVQRGSVLGCRIAVTARLAAGGSLAGLSGESGSSSGSSFLNCACVVVLVAGQSRASGKGLLAVGIWALVRTLSRVNATVAGQRTAVAEGLRECHVSFIWSTELKYFQNIPFHSVRTCEASRLCAHVGVRSAQSAE